MVWLISILLLAAPVSAIRVLGKAGAPAWVWAVFVGLNCGTFVSYWFDKRQAKAGGVRIPESGLHALEFAGGWPAAFMAQQFLRHKNAKTRYQVVFWLIVGLHQAIALDALAGWPVARAAFAIAR